MFRYLLIFSLLSLLLFTACGRIIDSEEINYSPCENGMSEIYPCNNIGLYAHVPVSELSGDYLNDIWGWIDPETNKEYAIIGMNNGVDIVDVTVPDDPIVIGQIPEPNSNRSKSAAFKRHDDGSGFKKNSPWRDMKVYQNTLYIVSEQSDYGLQYFDLTQLRNVENPPVMFDNFERYTEFGNAHNLFINSESQYLYVVGSTIGSNCAERGGLHITDISEPFQPEFAGCYFDENAGGFTTSGYIHDTQCVMYSGPDEDHQGKEICFSSSEDFFLISDVTEKENPSTVALTTYAGASYIHQGWLSGDQRYFFMNDELDESYNHHNTQTYVWDLEDLDNPEMIGYYQHNTEGIDHNLYIKDNLMYQANYSAGLRILDVTNPNPENITELAFFDTTPNDNTPSFNGLWSVYPWLIGDKIIVSDINQGLFILRFQP